MDHLKFTSYELETGKITGSFSHFPECGLPDGQDWIRGYVDGSTHRINPKTGKPRAFIEQEQLEYFIRKHAQRLRMKACCTDNDIRTAMINRELGTVTQEQYAAMLTKRRAIDACHDALAAMKPIPQDYTNPEYWK